MCVCVCVCVCVCLDSRISVCLLDKQPHVCTDTTTYRCVYVCVVTVPGSLGAVSAGPEEGWNEVLFIVEDLAPPSDTVEFPRCSAVKNLPANAGDTGDTGSIPGPVRSPKGGHGNPLQYSCLENSMDRGAWWATVHGVAQSQARLSTHTLTLAQTL